MNIFPGKLYNEGYNVNIMHNYESVPYPVPVNVPSISSLIASQWDHSQQWKIPTCEMLTQSSNADRQMKHDIDLNADSDYGFIRGHQIDGRCLFPATGYLVLVWKTFAQLNHYEDYRQMSVLFEHIQIHRATICSLNNKIVFHVNILSNSGQFEIIENNAIIVTGRISLSEQLMMQQYHCSTSFDKNTVHLQTNEIYRDFNLRGYEYSGLFRNIQCMTIDGTHGELRWNDEWISYLDTMLQVHLIPSQGLQLPTRIDSLRIHPQVHAQSIASSTSVCSVYVDYWNSLCLSGGVELIGLHCTGTSKKVKQQNAIVESYEFVPWTMDNIDNELRSSLYLIMENTLTTTAMSVCQIGGEQSTDDIMNFYLQQPSIKSLEFTLISSLPNDDINSTINRHENLSSITLSMDLIIVHRNDTHVYDWNTIVSTCKSTGFILVSTDIVDAQQQLQAARFIPIVQHSTYHLWRKSSQECLHHTIVHIDNPTYEWMNELKVLLTSPILQRIWLVSNQYDNGILGFFHCLRREPGGQVLR
jgi:fatty acid synthase, animal type